MSSTAAAVAAGPLPSTALTIPASAVAGVSLFERLFEKHSKFGVHLCEFSREISRVTCATTLSPEYVVGLHFRVDRFGMIIAHEVLEKLESIFRISLVSKKMYGLLTTTRNDLMKRVVDITKIDLQYPHRGLTSVDEGRFLRVYRLWLDVRLKTLDSPKQLSQLEEGEQIFACTLLHRATTPDSPNLFSIPFIRFLLDMDKTYHLGLTALKDRQGQRPIDLLQRRKETRGYAFDEQMKLLIAHEATLPKPPSIATKMETKVVDSSPPPVSAPAAIAVAASISSNNLPPIVPPIKVVSLPVPTKPQSQQVALVPPLPPLEIAPTPSSAPRLSSPQALPASQFPVSQSCFSKCLRGLSAIYSLMCSLVYALPRYVAKCLTR